MNIPRVLVHFILSRTSLLFNTKTQLPARIPSGQPNEWPSCPDRISTFFSPLFVMKSALNHEPKGSVKPWSAETESQNTIELRTTASEIVAPKPSRAAKDNSITNAATARSNLDTAITMRSAETELQNTTELRTTANLLTNLFRSLHAATPRRFPRSSCKRQ